MAELTAEQKEFYASLESTFNSQGWDLLTIEWTDELEVLKEQVFFGATDMVDVQAARVRYGLLNELVQLPQMIATQKSQIEEDENAPFIDG